ncbi:SDR family NAD(P)-dependent oxidoreductase [Streptomyces sp. NPDC021100]|uniref:type I polyketide synthase n=1 Tax=Streptomyces sp. NPDC021100 TaxID=3365114 RepID=UPI003796AC87
MLRCPVCERVFVFPAFCWFGGAVVAQISSECPVAVVGVGCRLPGGVDSLAGLWRLLEQRRDAVGPVPPQRWTAGELADLPSGVVARMEQGGFLDGDVFGFDPESFGMNEREALFTDPQHRLLWEVVWEALENAGMPVHDVAGRRVGQFYGFYAKDYLLRVQHTMADMDPYALFSGTDSTAAGRMGFLLDLHGPGLALEAACASSLVAVHTACQGLLSGEADVAVAGGVQLALDPGLGAMTARWEGATSPTGRSRPFDAAADGMVPAEGCAVVVLKRLADARRDGDRVLAVLRGSAVSVSGSRAQLAVTSCGAQMRVFRAALERAGVEPGDVGMVEAHGTGTRVGDQVEFAAVAEVYGRGRGRCALGSVKSNLGHSQAAAGVSGLLKAIAAVQRGAVPATLHFQRWSPLIEPGDTRLFVPTAVTAWPVEGVPRLAAVSSFGMTGANAHVIVEAPSPGTGRRRAPAARAGGAGERVARVFLLSGRTPRAVREGAGRLACWLEGDGSAAPLGDVAHTLAVRRSHASCRAGIVARDRGELVARLHALHGEREAEGVTLGRCVPGSAAQPGPVWVFGGHGSQRAGMGRGLLDADRAFTAVIDELEPLIEAESGFSLRATLTAAEEVRRIDHVQPALFALQLALAAMWRGAGVEPAAVIGHSMGEVAAAVSAGALSVRDGVRVVCHRSRLIATLTTQGLMASVALEHQEIEQHLADEGVRGVSVAGILAPRLTVIAGDHQAVRALAERWDAQHIDVRLVNVEAAGHSAHMDPLKDDLLGVLAKLRPRAARVPFYTTTLADPRERAAFDAAYWFANQRNTVRFQHAVRAALADGHRLFIELGPHPQLTGAVRANADGPVATVPSLVRGQEEPVSFLTHLAAFHAAGGVVDWAGMYGNGQLVDAPPTTWERRHLEVERRTEHGPAEVGGHPLLGTHLADPHSEGRHLWQGTISAGRLPWLADHTFAGAPVLPATGFAEMAVQAAVDLHQVPKERIAVRGLRLLRALPVARPVAVSAHATLTGPGQAAWTVHSGNPAKGGVCHATARLELAGDEGARPVGVDIGALLAAHPQDIDPADLYAFADEHLAAGYGPAFRGLRSLHGTSDSERVSVVAAFELPDAGRIGSRLLHCHPAVLDTAVHAVLAAWRRVSQVAGGTLVVTRIGDLRLHGDLPATGWHHAVIDEAGPRSVRGSVRVLAPDGTVMADMADIELASVPAQTPQERFASRLLGVRWTATELAAAPEGAVAEWVLVHTGDRPARAESLADALTATGAHATLMRDSGDALPLQTVVGEGGQGPVGVVFLPATTPQAGEQAVALARHHTTRLLNLARTLTHLDTTREIRLWACTCSAETVHPGDIPDLTQAGLRGALRTLGYEHPALAPTLLDTDARTTAEQIARELLACPTTQDHIAYRDGLRLTAALAPAALAAGDRHHRTIDFARDNAELRPRTVGDLDSLELLAATRTAPGPGEVEIRVHASSVNFVNVLAAAGTYQKFRAQGDDVLRTAWDCAGVLSAVGDGVTHLRVGDRVTACMTDLSPSSFVSLAAVSVAADWRVMPVADGMSLTDAAALPVAYLTAWHGLRTLARLRPGERVLIHCASGGVGQAAVNVARLCGATVFATAGSETKRVWLRERGIEHVMDSRSLAFADHIRRITGGRGVDVVLNCLTGPAQAASLEVLAPGGRFIEIGKKDIHAGTRISLLPLHHNAAFHTVDVARPLGPGFAESAAGLTHALHHRQLPPLPVTTYPVTEAASAFRTMARAQHTGKLVLTWPTSGTTTLPVRPEDVPLVRDDGAYLITGGLGGLGLLAARWLAQAGAATLVLTSRRAPSPNTTQEIEHLRATGTRVKVVLGDIADPATADNLVLAATATGHRLRGVLHAAAVIDDATLTNITPDLIDRVWRPKTLGTWRLHQATEDHEVDWWVLYSSAASTLGNGGQAAYSSANAWMEEFTTWRRHQGLPASCVSWGPWAEVGGGAFMAARGYDMITPDEGMDALRRLLAHDRPRTTYTPTDTHRWLKAHATADRLTYFAALHTGTRPTPTRSLLAALADCPGEAERLALLQQTVIHHAATVLHRDPADLNATTAFNATGLDSLMLTGLRTRLETDTGLRIPPGALWAQPDPAALAHYLLHHLNPDRTGTPT